MRYVMIVAVAALFVAGACGSAGALTPEEMIAVQAASHATLNAGVVDVQYWAEDGVYESVSGGISYHGKEEIAGFFEGILQGIPDFNATQRRILASGNTLITECTVTGTHQGVLLGIPATGKSVTLYHMDVWEFEGDKLERLSTYDDNVTMMVQLGLMPASELPPLVPSFTLPAPEPTGLSPLEANLELETRWNAGDLSGYAKMIHPDADLLVAALGVPMSRDAAIAAQELYLLGMSDRKEEIVRAIDMGDGWVLFEVVYRGTNDGPYFGIPATGRPFEVRAAGVNRFDADGLLIYQHVYFDNMTLFMQLGLVAAPEPSTISPSTWGEIKSRFR